MRLHNRNLTEAARTLRKNMTPQEKRLWYGFLREYPLRVRRQKVIGYFIADFYCSKAQLVIEIDGSQHFTPEAMERDKARTEFIAGFGIKVIRFTNTDVSMNFEGVCTAIDIEIRERVKTP